MKWGIEYHPEAQDDLDELDPSIRLRIIRAIYKKLSHDPKGHGDPLGSKTGMELTGLYSLRAANRKIRIIYFVRDRLIQVVVIAVGRRERFEVHRMAAERIRRLRDLTDEEFQKLKKLVDESTAG